MSASTFAAPTAVSSWKVQIGAIRAQLLTKIGGNTAGNRPAAGVAADTRDVAVRETSSLALGTRFAVPIAVEKVGVFRCILGCIALYSTHALSRAACRAIQRIQCIHSYIYTAYTLYTLIHPPSAAPAAAGIQP